MAPPDRLVTREALAQVARLSSNQVVQIEKIQKQGAPELVQAVKAGLVSINAAAAVASLPVQEQAAAAEAGAEELKQAAKRVREAKRKPGATAATPAELRQRVAELEAENQRLREQLQALDAAPLSYSAPTVRRRRPAATESCSGARRLSASASALSKAVFCTSTQRRRPWALPS